MELTYTKVEDSYIPDLALDDDAEYELGMYGRMREANCTLTIILTAASPYVKVQPGQSGMRWAK